MKFYCFLIVILFLQKSFSEFSEAKVTEIISNDVVLARAKEDRFRLHQIVALYSHSEPRFVYGFAEVEEIIKKEDGWVDIFLQLRMLTENKTVRPGDGIKYIDFFGPESSYPGRSELIVRDPSKKISSKYRALFTQGFSIGDAAETLVATEFYTNYLGQFYYGVSDNLSLGTIAPAAFFGGPNLAAKFRIYKGKSNIVSMGFNATKIPFSSTTTVNINFLWDSFSNQNTVTHTFATVAVYSLDNAEEATALKSVGSSSLQTGYEFILGNWDRVLIGPNYNFESKAIGGYVSYLWIWDRFHFQMSLNSTNIRSLKLSPVDGYFGFLDMYWRY